MSYFEATLLEDAFVVTDALILIGLRVILVVLAAFGFYRRDIGTGRLAGDGCMADGARRSGSGSIMRLPSLD